MINDTSALSLREKRLTPSENPMLHFALYGPRMPIGFHDW